MALTHMHRPAVLGATPFSGGTRFSLWALGHQSAAVEIEGHGTFPLDATGDGYFTGDVPGVAPGARYWFRIDGGPRLPDLASRCQPEGNDGAVHGRRSSTLTGPMQTGAGPSQQIRSSTNSISAPSPRKAPGRPRRRSCRHLRDLGVTVIQVMPVGTFKGAVRLGLRHDAALRPFAPYGTPDDMRAFVDAAHAPGHRGHPRRGLQPCRRSAITTAPIASTISPTRYENEWGASFNYDGEGPRAVRDFIVGNAVYWIEDFHLDGLRIDAAQAMFDASDEHIIAEITRACARRRRSAAIYVVGGKPAAGTADDRSAGTGRLWRRRHV